MTAGGPRAARLAAMRERGDDRVAPLWLDALEPDEGLREARRRRGDVVRLQEAAFLLALGRGAAARGVLSALTALPPGLGAVRERLFAAAPEEPEASEAMRSRSAALQGWLDRVRRWRRTAVV